MIYGESPENAVLRELWEECLVKGRIIRRTSHIVYGPDDVSISYLVDIGYQEPSLGVDPDKANQKPVLADVKWLKLPQIPERDRAYLWAAGLLAVGGFLNEVQNWGNNLSYPEPTVGNEPSS